MNTYHLRCRSSDLAELLTLGQVLGVIDVSAEGVVSPIGRGGWDEIGPKYHPVDEGQPLGEPVGGAADPYWHINFRTEHNLREIAGAMAAQQPEIAAGLSQLGRYFITDAEGNAVAPEVPMRVFL